MRFESVSLQEEHVAFVHDVMHENRNVLYSGDISLAEWQACLLAEDSDEAHFIILANGNPAAWLKLNGLIGTETAWISMLVVQTSLQRCGIGSFAVCFAEEFAQMRGFGAISIKTTADNAAALNCYVKLGYNIIEKAPSTFGDGVKRQGVTLQKRL